MQLTQRLLVAAAASASSRVARMQFLSSIPDLPEHLQTMREELARGDAQLFDVREPAEFARGTLACTDLVPLSSLQEGVKPSLPTDKLTYVHCAAGIRVHPASAILEAMGYERVVPLQEGYGVLRELGFEPREEA